MRIRYPPPLTPGSTIAITAPSAGVADHHRPRLDFCVAWLRARGYEVVVGECMDGTGVTSAPPRERAAELTAMLADPQIAAVVPPWGGELAVEILPHLDFEAIAAAPPTWLVGYSDTSTILTPLTLRTGVATIHGHNLMDTPYRLPPEVAPWWELAAAARAGATVSQSPPPVLRSAHAGFDRWEDGPEIAASTEYTLDEPTTGWSLLHRDNDDIAAQLDVTGRLIGGCLEVLAPARRDRPPHRRLPGGARTARGLAPWRPVHAHRHRRWGHRLPGGVG
jgi:muramoyltetrapeptide carboxypeptidase